MSLLWIHFAKFVSLLETAEIETGMADKSSWDLTHIRQKLGLVWRSRKKISPIFKDYFFLINAYAGSATVIFKRRLRMRMVVTKKNSDTEFMPPLPQLCLVEIWRMWKDIILCQKVCLRVGMRACLIISSHNYFQGNMLPKSFRH